MPNARCFQVGVPPLCREISTKLPWTAALIAYLATPTRPFDVRVSLSVFCRHHGRKFAPGSRLGLGQALPTTQLMSQGGERVIRSPLEILGVALSRTPMPLPVLL